MATMSLLLSKPILLRSFLSPVRPSRLPNYSPPSSFNLNLNLNFYPPTSPTIPFLYSFRSVRSHSNAQQNPDFDPEKMPDYDDDVEIPFEYNPPHKLPDDAPCQMVALDSNDPWAFLQGTPRKPVNHQVPFYRAMARTGAPPPPIKHPLMRMLREPEQVNGNTLTEREREIFTRIFETILSEKSTFQPRTVPTTFSPSTSLSALFESAVGPQQSGNEISFSPTDSIDKGSVATSLAMASSFEEYPPVLRLAAAKAAGLMMPNRTRQQKQDQVKNLTGLIQDMNNCDTDLALDQWMDEHVFSLVKDGHLESSSKDLLSGSYAYLLAEGMKILRTIFNDLAGVISIFERIKRLGAESYVLGCSVDVYNQVIAAKWEGYRDLYKIKDLIDEMEINGIQGDGKTVRALQEIMDDFSAMRSTEASAAVHTMFMDGAEDLLEQLNYKASIWNVPQTEDSITESLGDISD